MLQEQIHKDMITARRGDEPVAKSLLVTLYSEASRVGKDKRNGPSTDEEVIQTVRKFISNAEETQRILRERAQDVTVQARELEILRGYLPQQMTAQELGSAVQSVIQDLGLTGPKMMGQAMAELKKRHGGSYDARLASELVKQLIGTVA
jgi:uncharacterized protein YqeY